MKSLYRIYCWLFGHRFVPVYREKIYQAFAMNRKLEWRGKGKVKYYKCERCGKKITLTEGKRRGFFYHCGSWYKLRV